MHRDHIFREYDIRGIVGRDFDEEFALSLGRAFGSRIKQNSDKGRGVSVGRDVRLSSEILANRVIEGIMSSGVSVFDLGMCPTPLQYFSIHHLDLDGGVMVTGSHNPPEYNGFKLSVGKETIFGPDIQIIKHVIEHRPLHITQTRGSVEGYDIISAYRAFMENRFSYLSDPKYPRLRIAVDAGNGTAGPVAPPILEAMGCDVIPLYCEPDGRFPNHHPDPTVVAYLQDLIRVTKHHGADMGVGYDGDADRIGVVDSAGKIVWGDHLMIILARDILRRRPNAIVIGDVKCSQNMFDDIAKHGGRPIMWKTGHSLVKDKMRRERAVLAGEFSGHIFIADDYYGYDDAVYATCRLVEIMKHTGRGIRELLADVPETVSTPEIRVECSDERKQAIVETLVRACKYYESSGKGPVLIKKLYDIDGARVIFEKGWGLVRSSNTQPVIVMRFEAEDEESLAVYRKFLEETLRRLETEGNDVDNEQPFG